MPHPSARISIGDLSERTARTPDYERECQALLALASAQADTRDRLLQRTADFAMELCCAQTAGISLLERQGDEDVFRWHTVAGMFENMQGLTTRSSDCPCAFVVEAGEPLLFTALAKDFPVLASLFAPVHEALVLPIVSNGRTLGAMWVASLDEQCRFSCEDRRILTDLAAVAGGVLALVQTRERSLSETQRYSEVIAVLAHEFRNPLGPLGNAIDAIQLVNQGREPIDQYLAVAQRQVLHLRRLMDSLQDASRLDHDKLTISIEETSLGEVLADALASIEDRARERRHVLTIDMPPAGLRLLADPVRLTQVVANLLSNAVRYTPEGGHIAIRAGMVARDGAEYAEVVVSDNGIGIAPESLAHVFEPFAQFAQGHAGMGGGLGIGLAVAQRLAQLHGGKIELASEGPGSGTEARLIIPLRRFDAQVAVAVPFVQDQHVSQRILVVDDNADARFALGALLELEGHDIQLAADGPAALKLLENWHPTLALIDIGMPGMNGLELAACVATLPDHKDIRLIALTGHVSTEDKTAALRAGFHAHLAKPVDLEQLRKLLR
jgi:signal transduction histidine kinase